MKKINSTTFIFTAIIIALSSCGSKKDPARTYMPDMAYSRTIETYSLPDTTIFTTDASKRGSNIIYFNSMPVRGTMKRGELYPYAIANDSIGYKMSATVNSPLTDSLDVAGLAEAGRLYNINCAICHGEKGAGNGPLALDKIGGVANIASGEKATLSDGTMFHVITYGKGVMGSYASQLSAKQRWEVIKYIRTLQNPKAGSGSDSTAAKKAGDSSAVVKK
ncbi:MAG: cytochrome c [Ferruginibacter sp.]